MRETRTRFRITTFTRDSRPLLVHRHFASTQRHLTTLQSAELFGPVAMTVSDGIDCERAVNTHAHSIPSTTRRRRQSRWMAFAYLPSPASQWRPLPAPAATSTIRHTTWRLDASERLTKEFAVWCYEFTLRARVYFRYTLST